MGKRRTVYDRFFRDRAGRLVFGQRPNLPIIVWAVLELGWGVTYFRRALGLAVLTYVVIRLLT